MGSRYGVICDDCGHHFVINEGGGFFFHELNCDTCGRSTSVEFKSLDEIHLRYIKGLRGPYSVVSREFDEHVQKNYPGDPLTEAEYHAEVEKILKPCSCGGRFRFEAPHRCPKCRSTNLQHDQEFPPMCYD